MENNKILNKTILWIIIIIGLISLVYGIKYMFDGEDYLGKFNIYNVSNLTVLETVNISGNFYSGNITAQNLSAINITVDRIFIRENGSLIFQNPNGSSVCLFFNASLDLVQNNNVTGVTCP